MAAEAPLIERARAKINLTLHINKRRDDGWHELESLVVFAGIADRLSLVPAETLSLTMSGFGAAMLSEEADNLVLRSARELAARVPGLQLGSLHLDKTLPIAAGIGGGSADAAAALRLLARANDLAMDDQCVMEAARATGADVAVCVSSRARMMRGVGGDLGAQLKLPPLYAVLVNPRVAVETKAVFARLGLKPGESAGFGAHPLVSDGMSFEALLSLLKKGRNDMEDAAQVIAPVINHVIAVLSAAPGCKLVRMSGSGATCFALFETRHAALTAAHVLRRDHADWWVAATVLR
jgi:4-diphosphocytidyl-2-C-methyl-D-erythritol kinase